MTDLFTPGAVRFGTDGWRAVIAESFTFARVATVAAASGQVLQEFYGGQGVVIGYDRRFLAEHFAQAAAEAIAAQGIPVYLATEASPTPSLSWAAHQLGAAGALVLTASHNPAQYLGIKLKGQFGGSVPQAVTDLVEARLDKEALGTPLGTHPPGRMTPAPITPYDPWSPYLTQLRQQVDLAAIQASPALVWVDAMHGSAAGGMRRLLGEGWGPRWQAVREARDPLFGGLSPEPLPPQLQATMGAIATAPKDPKTGDLKVGLVFDGDGDRIAAIDHNGDFLSPQILIPILIDHLAARRGLRGEVVKTVSGSQLFAKVAALHQLPVTETPIGFKYIADRMQTTPVLLGGEESGGIGYLGHIPERDGLLSALYLLEAIAMTGQTLGQLYQGLQDRADYHSFYQRRDLHLRDRATQATLLQSLATAPFASILDCPVTEHLTSDGHKFYLADGSWLMIRPSGTEPVLRLYCEALSPTAVTALLDWAEAWAGRA